MEPYGKRYPSDVSDAGVSEPHDVDRLRFRKDRGAQGPQGTLFGNNATGGRHQLHCGKADRQLRYGGQATYNRFNQLTGEAYISGPLTETLRARLSGKIGYSDGWQRSYTRNDKNGRQRTYAGRLLLDWNPLDALKFELNINA